MEFLLNLAESLRMKEGSDLGLSEILQQHILTVSPATDAVRAAKDAIVKLAVERADSVKGEADEETEIKPTVRKLVEGEFRRGATLPVVAFPEDSATVQDSPRLALIVLDPETEWKDGDQVVERISDWTKERGNSPRLYPGSLVWCARKPGRELRDKVELWLAWQRVAREVAEGVLGAEFDGIDRAEVQVKVRDAEEASKDEVWASYRFVVLSGSAGQYGRLKVIDPGAGHASASETLCGRIIGALKSEALLNESVGAGYIDRHWPPTFEGTGAWPLTSLRQSFLDGSLTRLIDPDAILRRQIAAFVSDGDFGLASGAKNDGTYGRLWYAEPIRQEEVVFESSVFLLTKAKAEELRTASGGPAQPQPGPTPGPGPEPEPEPEPGSDPEPTPGAQTTTLRLAGTVPPEVWNRLGTKILPKLRSGDDLSVGIEFTVNVGSQFAQNTEAELRQILTDLELSDRVCVERSGSKGSGNDE